MNLTKIGFNSLDEVSDFIRSQKPLFVISSQTSTVIPYEQLEQYIDSPLYLLDMSQIPAELSLHSDHLKVRGAVTWQQAREFLRDNNLDIMTSPTEELALVLAGVATSCTGERCFSFGNLRSQIVSLKYLNYKGEEVELNQSQLEYDFLDEYKEEFKKYEDYKNAPFPRFKNEIDLMIGTEGQLGVITEVVLKTIPNYKLKHFFLLLPKWEESLLAHLEISKLIQKHRNGVLLCEFIDSNSFTYLSPEDRPNKGMDTIFFELRDDYFETFYTEFLEKLNHISQDDIFEISETKFHHIRKNIPRAIFEHNSKAGVVKVGTDIQVSQESFSDLLECYQKLTESNFNYNLFGHFGDQHLHFNFMPEKESLHSAQKVLGQLYIDVKKLGASPFAEHGIGLLKQPYIKNYLNKTHLDVFKKLKQKHDPNNIFFPQGFMNIEL